MIDSWSYKDGFIIDDALVDCDYDFTHPEIRFAPSKPYILNRQTLCVDKIRQDYQQETGYSLLGIRRRLALSIESTVRAFQKSLISGEGLECYPLSSLGTKELDNLPELPILEYEDLLAKDSGVEAFFSADEPCKYSNEGKSIQNTPKSERGRKVKSLKRNWREYSSSVGTDLDLKKLCLSNRCYVLLHDIGNELKAKEDNAQIKKVVPELEVTDDTPSDATHTDVSAMCQLLSLNVVQTSLRDHLKNRICLKSQKYPSDRDRLTIYNSMMKSAFQKKIFGVTKSSEFEKWYEKNASGQLETMEFADKPSSMTSSQILKIKRKLESSKITAVPSTLSVKTPTCPPLATIRDPQKNATGFWNRSAQPKQKCRLNWSENRPNKTDSNSSTHDGTSSSVMTSSPTSFWNGKRKSKIKWV